MKNTAPSEQPYELFMFARKHALSIAQAREVLDRYGGDRDGADNAAIAIAEKALHAADRQP